MSALSVVQVGVDHRRAPLAVLERLHRSLAGASPGELRVRCGGAVRLATCHRLELYLEGASPQLGVALFARWLHLSDAEATEITPFLAVRTDEDAALHLMSVTAGLESAVLGEDQIQGQVREAYREACAEREAGPLLHRLFHSAFRAGRRARSETALKQGGRSLAGSGVAWLARQLGRFDGAAVLVLGAGEMARVAAARLRERGVGRLLIANRTWSRAEELAAMVGGTPLPWAWRERILSAVRGVVCVTGAPEAVVEAEWLERAVAGGHSLAVVDLAVPRNVARPDPLPAGLAIADVESLAQRLGEDDERRAGSVAAARAIIDEELGAWVSWARARVAGVGRNAASFGSTAAG